MARIFPSITSDLYLYSATQPNLDEKQVNAHKLLQQEIPLKWQQRLAGFGLSNQERLQRLLNIHKSAFAAEVEAKYDRADFFWESLPKELKKLKPEAPPFDHIPKETFIKEILIDTHLAFYSGLSEDSKGQKRSIFTRAVKHLAWAYELTEFISIDNHFEVILAIVKERISIGSEYDTSQTPIDICEEYLAKYPSQEKCTQAILSFTFGIIQQKFYSQPEDKVNINWLIKNVDFIEKHFKAVPNQQALRRTLGKMFTIIAKRHFRPGVLSLALLYLQQAIIYHPNLEEPHQLWEKYSQQMVNLQLEVSKLYSEIPYGFSKTKSLDTIFKDAERGFSLAKKFKEDSEALSEQEGEDDSKQNETYIQNLSSLSIKEVTPFVLLPAFNEKQTGDIPFTPWLFSKRDIGTKALMAAAMIVLLWTTFSAIKQTYTDRQRDQAYHALIDMKGEWEQMDSITEEVEKFVDHLPAIRKDKRLVEVTSFYEQAFTAYYMEFEDISNEDYKKYTRVLKKNHQPKKLIMKRLHLIIIASILCLAFSVYLYTTTHSNIEAQGKLVNEIVDTELELESEDTPISYASFPLNEQVPVDMTFEQEVKNELGKREQKNQVRDWLLYTIISNLNLNDTRLNEALFDLPIIRYGFYQNLSNLSYGETRSRVIKDKTVVALIPESSAKDRIDHLGHIADLQRKDLGELPDSLLVFEYSLSEDLTLAMVSFSGSIAGKELFSEDYGYYETTIASLDDLEAFMGKVGDLTFVKKEANTLRLGGRKLLGRPYKNIRVEDIAAVWQSEQKIAEKQRAFELKERAFNNKWNNKTYQYDFERRQLEAERDKEYEELIKEAKASKIVDGSGFSLDWEYDYQQIKYELAQSLPVLDSIYWSITGTSKYSNELLSQDNDVLKSLQNLEKYTSSLFTPSTKSVSRALDEKDISPLFMVIDRLQKGEDIYYQMWGFYLESLVHNYTFQMARYDGELQGTDVGMILFYTDLMAKVWSMDFSYSSPHAYVPELVTDLNTKVSNIYKTEAQEYSSCRLWFGPNQKGYQLTEDKEIFFSRNTTKVYSASSNPLQPGEEVPANAFLGAPIEWWNNHLEEIATYEPQYEALNEIIKWSLIIGWLNNEYSTSLSFLNDVKVYRNHWFPQWAQKHAELKFKKWAGIEFYPRNYLGTTTETLPLLVSPPIPGEEEGHHIYGGVSLASRSTIKAAPRLVKTTPRMLRRSNFQTVSKLPNGRVLKTSNGLQFKITRTVGKNRLNIKAPESVKLRNRFSEVHRSREFNRTFSRSRQSTTFEATIDDVPVGDLGINPTGNGFSVGFRAREANIGQGISRQMSTSRNPGNVLRQAKGKTIDDYLPLAQNESYLVKVKGGNRWMEVEIAKTPKVNLDAKWMSRTSGKGTSDKIVRQRWLSQTEAEQIAQTHNKVLPKRGPPKNQASEVFKKYQNKEFDDLANQIAKSESPSLLKGEINKFWNNELQAVDELMANPANYNACRTKLDYLATLRGDRPELIFRRALLDLNQKSTAHLKSGVYRFNRAIGKAKHGETKLLDEVNSLLKRPNRLTEGEKRILQEFTEYSIGTRHHIFAQMNRMPQGVKATPKEVFTKLDAGKAKITIHDQAKLNNLDWNVSSSQTLQTVLEAHPNAVIIRVPKTGLRDYRLNMNVVLKSTSPKIGRGTSFRPYFNPIRPSVRNIHNDECDEHDPNCIDEYIIYIPSEPLQ